MVVENYKIMGVAKAALEARVRYMAANWGRRVSVATRSRPARSPRGRPRASRSSTSSCRRQRRRPRRGLVDIDDVDAACALLAPYDASRLITGQVLYVEGGSSIID